MRLPSRSRPRKNRSQIHCSLILPAAGCRVSLVRTAGTAAAAPFIERFVQSTRPSRGRCPAPAKPSKTWIGPVLIGTSLLVVTAVTGVGGLDVAFQDIDSSVLGLSF